MHLLNRGGFVLDTALGLLQPPQTSESHASLDFLPRGVSDQVPPPRSPHVAVGQQLHHLQVERTEGHKASQGRCRIAKAQGAQQRRRLGTFEARHIQPVVLSRAGQPTDVRFRLLRQDTNLSALFSSGFSDVGVWILSTHFSAARTLNNRH